MGAGRHGGYSDGEYRGRESELNGSRREFTGSKEDYGSFRNSRRDNKRDKDSEAREAIRVRQKDIKEREVMYGGYLSCSSRSDSGSSERVDLLAKSVDKEPGELSSETDSDDAIDTELEAKDSNQPKVVDNGAQAPVVKKRKFSPIVWDMGDKEPSNVSRSRNSLVVPALPPLPPLTKSVSASEIGDARVSPAKKSKTYQHSPSINPPVVSELDVSPVRLSSQSPLEKQLINEHEAENLDDEEDYIPTRHILSSRWAAGNNSPADEVEIGEAEGLNRMRKKMSVPGSLQSRVRNRSLTPELGGELRREGSEGARMKGSESNELNLHSESMSGEDDYEKNDVKGDRMEVDEELGQENKNLSGTNSDSDSERNSPGLPEPLVPQRNLNMLQGCRSVDEYVRLNKIDEGTYGVVYRAKDKKTGEVVALKKVKMEKEREGFPLTALREINILISFHHPAIVDVKEVVIGSNLDSIFMVMEYMEHDLKGLMETMKQPYSQSEVKCLMLQLLDGVKYLHDNWVLHRDLKTSNILLNNRGELKICDFGLARQYGSPLKPYTHLVVTLWYRAPELLLGAKEYSTAIDMWSLGCIMAELLSKRPLFNGRTEFDQLDKIFKILGTPNESIWPGFSKLPGVKVNYVKHQYNLLRKKFPPTSFTGSPVLSDAGFDLLNKLLTYDPSKRISAEDALKHEWFREVPLPKSKDFMPTFPAQHAQDRRSRRVMKSPDPLEEQRRKELQQGELGTGGLFG